MTHLDKLKQLSAKLDVYADSGMLRTPYDLKRHEIRDWDEKHKQLYMYHYWLRNNTEEQEVNSSTWDKFMRSGRATENFSYHDEYTKKIVGRLKSIDRQQDIQFKHYTDSREDVNREIRIAEKLKEIEDAGKIRKATNTIVRGFVDGLILTPAAMISGGLELASNNEGLGNEVYSYWRERNVYDIESTLGRTTKLAGGITPIALTLIYGAGIGIVGTAGVSAKTLTNTIALFYAAQGFGAGVQRSININEIRGENAKLHEKLLTGITAAGIEYALERVGLGEHASIILKKLPIPQNALGAALSTGNKKLVQKINGTIAKQIVDFTTTAGKHSLVEGAEESLTEALNGFSSSLINKGEINWLQGTGSAFMGGAGGGVLLSPISMFNQRRSRRSLVELAQKHKMDFNDLLTELNELVDLPEGVTDNLPPAALQSILEIYDEKKSIESHVNILEDAYVAIIPGDVTITKATKAGSERGKPFKAFTPKKAETDKAKKKTQAVENIKKNLDEETAEFEAQTKIIQTTDGPIDLVIDHTAFNTDWEGNVESEQNFDNALVNAFSTAGETLKSFKKIRVIPIKYEAEDPRSYENPTFIISNKEFLDNDVETRKSGVMSRMEFESLKPRKQSKMYRDARETLAGVDIDNETLVMAVNTNTEQSAYKSIMQAIFEHNKFIEEVSYDAAYLHKDIMQEFTDIKQDEISNYTFGPAKVNMDKTIFNELHDSLRRDPIEAKLLIKNLTKKILAAIPDADKLQIRLGQTLNHIYDTLQTELANTNILTDYDEHGINNIITEAIQEVHVDAVQQDSYILNSTDIQNVITNAMVDAPISDDAKHIKGTPLKNASRTMTQFITSMVHTIHQHAEKHNIAIDKNQLTRNIVKDIINNKVDLQTEYNWLPQVSSFTSFTTKVFDSMTAQLEKLPLNEEFNELLLDPKQKNRFFVTLLHRLSQQLDAKTAETIIGDIKNITDKDYNIIETTMMLGQKLDIDELDLQEKLFDFADTLINGRMFQMDIEIIDDTKLQMDKSLNAWQRFVDTIDVETKFKRVGLPMFGETYKIAGSIKNALVDLGLHTQYKVQQVIGTDLHIFHQTIKFLDTSLTSEEFAKLSPDTQVKIEKVADILQSFYKTVQTYFQDKGVNFDFAERVRIQKRTQIEKLEEKQAAYQEKRAKKLATLFESSKTQNIQEVITDIENELLWYKQLLAKAEGIFKSKEALNELDQTADLNELMLGMLTEKQKKHAEKHAQLAGTGVFSISTHTQHKIQKYYKELDKQYKIATTKNKNTIKILEKKQQKLLDLAYDKPNKFKPKHANQLLELRKQILNIKKDNTKIRQNIYGDYSLRMLYKRFNVLTKFHTDSRVKPEILYKKLKANIKANEKKITKQKEKLNKQMEKLAERSAKIQEKTATEHKLDEQLAKDLDEEEALQEYSYVHIPTYLLYNKNKQVPKTIEAPGTLSPASIRNKDAKMAYKTPKVRRTLYIDDLISSGTLSITDITPANLITMYAERAGDDLILASLIDSGIKDGGIRNMTEDELAHRQAQKKSSSVTKQNLEQQKTRVDATKTTEPTFIGDQNNFIEASDNDPALAGLLMHPIIKDIILSKIGPNKSGRKNLLYRTLVTTKLLTFYNPVFLGVYDIIQGIGAFGPNVLRFRHFYNAYKDFSNRTPEWYQAEMTGRSSQPVTMHRRTAEAEAEQGIEAFSGKKSVFNKQFALLLNKLKGKKKPSANKFHKFVQFFTRYFDGTMDATHSTAWILDSIIRQTTWRYLRDVKKYSVEEASRETANIHADYASVPKETAELLNYFLYTPVFKIAMSKWLYKVVRAPFRVSKDLGQVAIGGKNLRDVDKIELGRSANLVNVIILYNAIDYMFTELLGFERDTFARRYKKKVESDIKGAREFVLTFSTPHNLVMREVNRFMAVANPATENPIKRIFETHKSEFQPLYNVTLNVLNNTDNQGNSLYFINDEVHTKVAKTVTYALVNVFKLLSIFGEDITRVDMAQSEESIQFAKEIFGGAHMATRLITYNYTRTPKEIAEARKLNRIYSSARKDLSALWDVNDERFNKLTFAQKMHKSQNLTDVVISRLQKQIKILDEFNH